MRHPIKRFSGESGGGLAQQVSESQTTKLTAFQRSAAEKHAQCSALLAIILFRIIVLAFVSFAQKLR
jgi:hypothetical protein